MTARARVRGAFVLCLACVGYANAASVRADGNGDNSETASSCVDVGVQMHVPRLSSMPLEELSELQTGKSCARSAMVTIIADEVERQLDVLPLDVVDCVATQVDEQVLGVYTIMRVCSRDEGTNTLSGTKWEAQVRPRLAKVLADGASSVQYHRSKVLLEKVKFTKSYTRKALTDGDDEKEDAPRFRYKSAELWSETSSAQTNKAIVIKLRVKNDGKSPLHVFAATLKDVEDPLLTNGALLLASESIEGVAASKEATIIFRHHSPKPIEIENDRNYAVYFVHTASRAHILEGTLDGKKLKINEKRKPLSKGRKDLVNFKLDGSNTLGGGYSFPYGMWQLLSMAIVMVVGIVTTLFMRRKWMRVDWKQILNCQRRTRKTTGRSKMTEMTSSKQVSQSSDDDADALESDGLLASPKEPPKVHGPKKIASSFREKMPAITMQWKKPDNARGKISSTRALKLDTSVRLDPKRFESMWDEYIQRYNCSMEATRRPTIEAFVIAMQSIGVVCMASGTVEGVEKYVLYAKQQGTNDFFFVTIDIHVASAETNFSVRASEDVNESLMKQFVEVTTQKVQALLT